MTALVYRSRPHCCGQPLVISYPLSYCVLCNSQWRTKDLAYALKEPTAEMPKAEVIDINRGSKK